MAPAPPHLGFLLLLACCFSSSETQLLDWIWGNTKTTGSPAAPSEGTAAPEPLASAAAPTPSASPGTWGGQVVGDVTIPQRQEPDDTTAAPAGKGTTAENTEQWDGNATGLVENTAQPSITPPHTTLPAPGQDEASSSTEDPQLPGTGTTKDPQLLGTGPPAATGTWVSLQRPAGPWPGSAPFPFSPGDGTHEQAVPPWDPMAQMPQHHHGASPAPPNLRHGTGRQGLVLAGMNGSQSPPLPNRRAANSVDPPLADNASPREFDLLTAAARLYGSGAGLASFLPRLMPPAGHCLPVPTRLPFCSVLATDHFRLPNYLRHSSEVEIWAALHEWEGLLESRCHRYVEWFLCLLLLPGCSALVPITPPPCQGFCEAIRDQCWTHLAGGRLPLPCDALPEEDEGYSCIFINASAGNVAG